MQGQGPDVVCLLPQDADFDSFGLPVPFTDNSEGVGIESGTIEIRGDFSRFRRRNHTSYPVKGERVNSAHFHAIGDQVPAPPERLQSVRLDLVTIFSFFIVGMAVDDLQASVLLHRSEYGSQIGVTRGDRLQRDPSAQAFTIYQEVVHGEGFQQPAAQIVAHHVVAAFDVVFVRPAVAGDIHVEQLFNGFPVVLKGLSGQFLAARHLVPLPTDADFIKGDTARGVNHVQEPQITAKQGRGVIRQGIHRSKVFHKDKNSFRQNSTEALVFYQALNFFIASVSSVRSVFV